MPPKPRRAERCCCCGTSTGVTLDPSGKGFCSHCREVLGFRLPIAELVKAWKEKELVWAKAEGLRKG